MYTQVVFDVCTALTAQTCLYNCSSYTGEATLNKPLNSTHLILEVSLPTLCLQHLAFVWVKCQLPCPRPVHQGVNILLDCVAAVQVICPTVHLGVITKQLYEALNYVRHIVYVQDKQKWSEYATLGYTT